MDSRRRRDFERNSNDSSLDERAQLRIAQHLYGREEELRTLTSVWHRVSSSTETAEASASNSPDNATNSSSRAEAVLVQGVSGSGKTGFCRQLAAYITNDNVGQEGDNGGQEGDEETTTTTNHQRKGYFVSGKFEQYSEGMQREPYAVIVQALHELGKTVMEQGTEEDVKQLQSCLQNAILLKKLVPAFASATSVETNNNKNDTATLLNEEKKKEPPIRITPGLEELFAVALRFFLHSFCNTPERSLVLMIDDMQWSDEGTLDLLVSLMTHNEPGHFLLLAAFRKEQQYNDSLEQTSSSSSLVQLQSLSQQNIQLTDIILNDLDLESTTQMIADMVRVHKDNDDIQHPSCIALAETALRKTNGNPHFIKEFMKMLVRRHLLVYNQQREQWEWDDRKIAADADPSENVVQMLTLRLNVLPAALRRVLQTAACLGFVFDIRIVQTFFEAQCQQDAKADGDDNVDAEDFAKLLQRAQREGLVEVITPTATTQYSTAKFSHDKIQQSVREILSEEERKQLHHKIGTHIKDLYLNESDNSKSDSAKYVFLAADQLNRAFDNGAGAQQQTVEKMDDQDRLDLMHLNLRASLAAREKSGIALVAGFLDKAISLVKDDSDWTSSTTSYHLVQEIYTLSCEAEFSRGRFVVCHDRINVLERKGRTLQDKIRALVVKVQIFGVQREFGSAIQEARTVLSLLDERLPSSLTINVILEFLKAKRLAKGRSDEYFLNLEPMKDWKKVIAMKVLKVASVYGWNRGDKTFTGLCFLRLFIVTLKYGYCEDTSYGLATFGMMLAATNDEAEGVRFAKLALKNVSNQATYPATAVAVYVFLWHLKHPVTAGLDPLLSSYRMGLETGEMEFGSIAFSAYVDLYMFCGLPLVPFASDVRNFGEQLRLCKQELPLSFILPYYRLTCNLCGFTKDPMVVTWESCREEVLFSENFLLYPDSRAMMNLHHAQLFNAIIMQDTDRQIESLELIRKLNNYELDGTHFSNYFFCMSIGLASFSLLRKTKRNKYLSLAKRMIRWLRQATQRRSLDCVGILNLLEAEHAALLIGTGRRGSGAVANAREMYAKAISCLARSGFIHFCAIACELNGRLFEKDPYWFEVYMLRAAVLYEEWGAVTKVKAMGAEYDFIEPGKLRKDDTTIISIRGRERFDAKSHSFRRVSMRAVMDKSNPSESCEEQEDIIAIS